MEFITSPGLYVYRTLRRKLQLSLIELFYKRAFMKQENEEVDHERENRKDL